MIKKYLNKGISTPLAIGIMLILVIIVGGFTWWQYGEIRKEEANTLEAEIVKKEVKDETTDWKVYKDEQEGFEIKYPKDWHTVPVSIFFNLTEQNGIGLTNVPKEKIEKVIAAESEQGATETQEEVYGLATRVSFSSIEAWLERTKEMCNLIKAECFEKEIKIGDNNGYQVTVITKTGEKGISTVLYGNKRVYIIDPFYPSKCKTEECEIFNKIISTFRFIEIKSSVNQDLSCEYKKGEYEFRVYDSEGRITGIVNGKLKQEIPMSVYENGSVEISFPQDYYEYELYCIKDGNYQFKRSSTKSGETITFKATNIPIFAGMTHRYKTDWKALSEGKDGVTLLIDADGDGKFEKTLPITGTEFTCQQFLTQISNP